MRPLWTGSIGFGLVNIPVKLYSATQNSELDLDMLDKKDRARIRFKRVNENTGKEVEWENIVRAFDVDGRYVVVTDQDVERASAQKSAVIEVERFVKEEEVDGIYFETPYYLAPDKPGMKAYALLREALIKSGRAGVGTFVMRNKEHLALLRARGEMLMLMRLRFDEEIRDPEELNLPAKAVVPPRELKLALALIDQLSTSFDIRKYKDTFTASLIKTIRSKAKGGKVPVQRMEVVHRRTKDLMDQLQASLGKSGRPARNRKPARAAGRRKAS